MPYRQLLDSGIGTARCGVPFTKEREARTAIERSDSACASGDWHRASAGRSSIEGGRRRVGKHLAVMSC